MPTFQDWESGTLAPKPMRGLWWSKLWTTLGHVKDLCVDAAKDAVKARFAAVAPDDALPYIGAERGLPQYPSEDRTAYRARLLAAWDFYPLQGTTKGIASLLSAGGFPGALFYNRNAAPSWYAAEFGGSWPPATPIPGGWSRFWIELAAPTLYGFTLWRWGDGTKFGSGKCWGSSATPQHVALVRSIVRKAKAAHERCAEVFVRLADGAGGFVTARWLGV